MPKSRAIVTSVIFCQTLLAAGRAATAQEFRVEGAGLEAGPASYAFTHTALDQEPTSVL